jgi:hypothetical protein
MIGRCLTYVTFALATFVLLSGCDFRPPPVSVPKFDPEKIADEAMKLCDSNGDGFLDKNELKTAPGLEFASKALDENKDKKLSREEVLQRFKDLVEAGSGMVGFTCFVLRGDGTPLEDAMIKLIPEPFLAEYIPEAEGQTVDYRNGAVNVTTPNSESASGVRPGMYRVEIRSNTLKIPAKYNDKSVLGVEVIPFTDPNLPPGGITFVLR